MKQKANARAGQVVRLLAPEGYFWKGCCSNTFDVSLAADCYIPDAEKSLTKHLYYKYFPKRYQTRFVDHARRQISNREWTRGQHNLKEEDKKFIGGK